MILLTQNKGLKGPNNDSTLDNVPMSHSILTGGLFKHTLTELSK